MKKDIFTNRNLFYIIYIPIFLNFLINIAVNFSNSSFRIDILINYTSTLLLFLYLVLIGLIIKGLFNLPTISVGIVVYLLSFFLIDNIILFFYTGLKFQTIFTVVNFIWLTIFFLFTSDYLKILFSLFIYGFLNFLNNIFFEYLTVDKNIIGDVKDIHYPHVKNIYENSYYYSMNYPTLEGYPQLVAHMQSVLSSISLRTEEFFNLSSTINVLFLLFVLFFYEIKLSKKSKYILIFVFASIVLNSKWLSFLFFDSLMTEGMLSYTFSVLLMSLIFSKPKDSLLIFIFMGLMFISKQFISTLSLLVVCIYFFNKNYKKYAIFGLVGVLIKELSFLTYFRNIQKNYHLKEVDLVDTLFDILLFRNLEISNIKIILKNLYIDKPLTLLIFFFLVISIYYLIIYKNKTNELNIVIFILYINFLLIFLLYITLWRGMELESPIRYMLNLLPLIAYVPFKIFDDKNLESK